MNHRFLSKIMWISLAVTAICFAIWHHQHPNRAKHIEYVKSVGSGFLKSAKDAAENLLDVDDCPEVNPCKNGGVCVDSIKSYTCDCKVKGYGGTHCETNIDDCLPNPCQNSGKCFDELNGFSCACASGWEGKTCTESVDDCDPEPCKNGALCIDGDNSFTCSCKPGWVGRICETSLQAVQGAAPALNLNNIKPVYKGCYTDERGNRALPSNLKISQDLTNPKCWQHCTGYKYAGTQFAMECWCGNELRNEKADDKDCSSLCTGDRTSACGGPLRLTVFQINE